MAEPKQKELTTYQTGVLQARAYRSVRSFINSHLRGHDITFVEWCLLGLSYDYTVKGGIKVSQLAELLNVEMSLITTTLNRLEAQGYVQRLTDSNDGRARRVIVTRPGEKLVQRIEKRLSKKLQLWFEDIHDKQLGLYVRTLQKMAKK